MRRKGVQRGLLAIALGATGVLTSWAGISSASAEVPSPTAAHSMAMVGLGDSIMHGDDAWGGLEPTVRAAGFTPQIDAVSSRGLWGGAVHPTGLEVLKQLAGQPGISDVRLWLNELGANQYELNGSPDAVNLQAREEKDVSLPITYAQAVAIAVNRERDMSPQAEILWMNMGFAPGKGDLSERNAVLMRISQLMGFRVLDYAGAVLPGGLGPDGIHPTVEGDRRLNEMLLRELQAAHSKLAAGDQSTGSEPALTPVAPTAQPADAPAQPVQLPSDMGAAQPSPAQPAPATTDNPLPASDPSPPADVPPAVPQPAQPADTATPDTPAAVPATAVELPTDADAPDLPVDAGDSGVAASAVQLPADFGAAASQAPDSAALPPAVPQPAAAQPAQPQTPLGVDSAGGACPLNGSSNEEIIFRYLKCRGLRPFRAAGIMGNMSGESAYDPTSQEPGTHSDRPHNDGTGYGLVGWTPGTDLQAVADRTGRPVNDLGFQLDVLWAQLYQPGSELVPPYKGGSTRDNSDVGRAISGTDSVQAATEAFEDGYEHHYVDGSARWPKHQPWRLAAAIKVLDDAQRLGW